MFYLCEDPRGHFRSSEVEVEFVRHSTWVMEPKLGCSSRTARALNHSPAAANPSEGDRNKFCLN